jgi:hypothetical protein
MDSKHKELIGNYPVTALGILDAGQFNLIALALSSKEDETCIRLCDKEWKLSCNQLVYIWTQNVKRLIIVMPFRSHF